MHSGDIDLTYNPFQDEDNALTSQRQPYFGSGLAPTFNTPSSSRRRLSITESQTSSGSTIRRRRRSRSRPRLELGDTTDSLHSQPVSSGHPLKSAALRTSDFQDFDVTRPNLSRAVHSTSVSTSLFNGSAGDDTDDNAPVREQETQVLVHEIAPTDSLAGVSLKYGIVLSELRRANQLWPNDPIHLREVLYIPLHRASRAHEHIIRRPASASSSSADLLDTSSSNTDAFLDNSGPSPSLLSPETAANVRRIPVSQLSYFPPSSNAFKPYLSASEISSTSSLGESYVTSNTMPNQNRPRMLAPQQNSFSTLLNSLPIAASTRDEIVSRLSLDSVGSGHSDRGRSGTTSSEDDLGHELHDVNRPKLNTSISSSQYTDLHSDAPQTPRSSRGPKQRSFNGDDLGHPPNHVRYGHQKLSTSPPSRYVPQITNPYIHTTQMEPSPSMRFPLARSQSEGYSISASKIGNVKQRQGSGTNNAKWETENRPKLPSIGFGNDFT
ncbi:hypothetical protein FA15DRAFT_639857 [Coprinopsis marcescibilis]|uniref:LysM domain-containing protein n=1 Tax=Coprinopsis marcescibilis TaxID=230819 RepID=A0A5C3KXR1_COPMA|nr:hypothetical protein FA15DRAFT_639857 [Coprinopsis marcescibilis]